MITAIAMVLSAQQSLLGAPNTYARALNQNQVTYFCDLAIIEVGTVESSLQDRIVKMRSGSSLQKVRVQSARVIDANFDHDGETVLVFPWRKDRSLIARVGAMPHPDALPLQPGWYFVAGRTESDGTVAFTPETPSNGMRITTFDPEIRLGTIQASAGEMAVFSVFPTSARALETHGREPVDVLKESLIAASEIRGSLLSQADVIHRTDFSSFGDLRQASAPMVDVAKSLANTRTGVERAILLAIVYEAGDPMVEQDLFWELVESERTEPGFWDGAVGRNLLTLMNAGTQSGISKYSYWRRNPERQVWLASLMAQTDSARLRRLFIDKMTNKHDPRMNPHLRRVLPRIEPGDGSCIGLLTRMADWFDEPDRKPGRRNSGETRAEYRARLQESLNYWQAVIGR